MNQTQSYLDMHPGSHISTGPSYSNPATAGPMAHYPQYQQTSVMQPGSAHYAPPTYGGYGYGNTVTSPQSAGPLPSMIPGASTQHYAAANGAPAPGYATQQVPFDTTGQVAPPGMKPRVTATLWEDEGSLCFQVEAKGVCVARREDNHFINGTKLLNVAGMTRGRRDGILKSEKTRHVVKIGPMHLKGVWIPFERALEFANKEKITDQLYPLFVHNIGGLLYSPENASRTNAVAAAAADRQHQRRIEGPESNRSSQPSGTPSSIHHHHSMQTPTGSQVPPTPHSIAPHPSAGRPGIDRAHTFPTPPTSASSVIGMSTSGNTYEWGNQNMSNGVAGSQPLSIDTSLNNARSMPTTPATTPPGNNVQNMNSYQAHQAYDSKHYYASTPSSQTGYSGQTTGRYDGYKTDMGPPTAPNSGPAEVSHDSKHEPYSSAHGPSTESGDQQENTYPSQYASTRTQYGYTTSSDQHHLSPEMTNSPSHQNTSGRATPRTMPSGQSSWAQDYQTPPRTSTGSNLYNIVGDTRSSTSDNYTSSNYSASSHPGPLTGKRGRDDDDDGRSGTQDIDNYKRQKIGRQEPFGVPLNQTVHMQAIKSGGGLPRQR